MKKTLSVFVVLMVVSSVVFARGIDKPSSTSNVAVVKNGTTFKLYYKASQHDDVKISIRDASDNVLFSETIKQVDGFVRPYNFSKLPDGEYIIQVANKSGRQVERITVAKDKTEKLAHLLKVSGADSKYLLTVSNKEGNDLTVRIFDSANNLIYNQKEEVTSDFAKVYNLEKIDGEFTFEVSDGNGISKSLRRD